MGFFLKKEGTTLRENRERVEKRKEWSERECSVTADEKGTRTAEEALGLGDRMGEETGKN